MLKLALLLHAQPSEDLAREPCEIGFFGLDVEK
jgi:hypothetical protein